MSINIALIGAVSAGKSTLINALFVEQYSDMNIKRTTTMPQVYRTDTKEIPKTQLNQIRENNRSINLKYMTDTSNGIELKLSDVNPINYTVPRVYDLIDLHGDTQLIIHDLPGLNDSMTKKVYHQYVEQAFFQYDIIIFVVDVYQSLNTSDEIDILRLILRGMKLNKTDHGMDCRLIILINKCDELEYDEKERVYQPSDAELRGMVDQVRNIIHTCKNEIYPDALIEHICVSCEDAYIYRMYARDPETHLDVKYLNKFGSNEYGKTRWNRLAETKKQELIKILFKDFDYEDRIRQCGFTQFKESLKNLLTVENQYNVVMRHIKRMIISSVDRIISDNRLDGYIDRVDENDAEYAEMITDIQQQFNAPSNRSMLDCETIRAIEHYIGWRGLTDDEQSYKYPTNFDKTSNEYAEFCNALMSKKIQLEEIIDTVDYIPTVDQMCGRYMDILKNVHNNCRVLKIKAVMIHAESRDYSNFGYTFRELFEMIIELKNDGYDDDKLIKLIIPRYKYVYHICDNCGADGRLNLVRLADGKLEFPYQKILMVLEPEMKYMHFVKCKNLLDQQIISEIKEISDGVRLSYANTIELIYATLCSNSGIALQGPVSRSSVRAYSSGDLFKFIDMDLFKFIDMNQSMYINSVHIRTTNPYYKKICMYKNILARAKYNDRMEEHSIDFTTYIREAKTLDIYFIQMLKKGYPYDVMFVDHMIDNHLNKSYD